MIIDLMVDEALLRVRQAVVVVAIEGKVQMALRVTAADKEHLRDVYEKLACAEQRVRVLQRFNKYRSLEAAGEVEVTLPWGRACRVKDLGLFGDGSGQYYEIYERNLLNGLDDILERRTTPEYVREAIRVFWADTLQADRAEVAAGYADCMQDVYESIS